jgi:type IV secretion system protein VirB9
MKRVAMFLLAAVLATSAAAADIPRRSTNDARVRYVTYKVDDVVVINVRRGVVTRVILDQDERITSSGSGFAAQCDKDDLEWCIRADRGTNQVWVKPRDRATHTNLELATNKRDYSIRFNVLPDSVAGNGDEMYRVIFQYPVPSLPLPPWLASGKGAPPGTPGATAPEADPGPTIDELLSARPVARNAKYSMEAIQGGKAIAPSLVFDDGRYTYLRFPNNREVPAPFVIGADNTEARVNFHVDGDLMVLHKVAPKIVLRLGSAVVGIWNDAYDADGIATPRGAVVPTVTRDIK